MWLDDAVKAGLLVFGMVLIVFRRELAATYSRLAKRYFGWEPVVLATVYMVGGDIGYCLHYWLHQPLMDDPPG